MQVLWCSRL